MFLHEAHCLAHYIFSHSFIFQTTYPLDSCRGDEANPSCHWLSFIFSFRLILDYSDYFCVIPNIWSVTRIAQMPNLIPGLFNHIQLLIHLTM